MSKVSVIIPVYNTENFLRECLDSVINQTLKDIEIICVDDGSTDDSLNILKEYAEKDNRIKVLTQKNKGAGAARNLGLINASGEYLSFPDADDFFELDMLEKFYQKAKDENSDIVVCNFDYFNNNTKEIIKNNEDVIPIIENVSIFNRTVLKDETLKWFKEFAWNKIFKKDFIDKNNIRFQEIKRANDLLFVKSSIALADKISTIDENFAHYRVGLNTNLSTTNSKTPLEFTKALIELKKFLVEKGIYDKLKKSYTTYCEGLIVYTLRTLKTDPIKYYELKKYVFKFLIKELDLNKKNISCWSDLKLICKLIFSIQKIKFTSKYLLIFLGKRICLG